MEGGMEGWRDGGMDGWREGGHLLHLDTGLRPRVHVHIYKTQSIKKKNDTGLRPHVHAHIDKHIAGVTHRHKYSRGLTQTHTKSDTRDTYIE